jgi:tRNA-Thr(GGU) m(6)t(6)A37 methyltransferase TsaA
MKLDPIAFIQSCFKEKFGVPHQPLQQIEAKIVFESNFQDPNWFKGLENISHIWITFGFNLIGKSKQITVRPPRANGERFGVFATRSPHRPNALGLSLVKIKEILPDGITVLGNDFVDGTPVYDIKPFHPEFDQPKDFQAGWMEGLKDKNLEVKFGPDPSLEKISLEQRETLIQTLARNPSPHFHQSNEKQYKFKMFNFDITWEVGESEITVLKAEVISGK